MTTIDTVSRLYRRIATEEAWVTAELLDL